MRWGKTLEPLEHEVDHIELLHDCDPEELENRFKQFKEGRKMQMAGPDGPLKPLNKHVDFIGAPKGISSKGIHEEIKEIKEKERVLKWLKLELGAVIIKIDEGIIPKENYQSIHDCLVAQYEAKIKKIEFKKQEKIRKEIQFLEDYETVATAIKAPWLHIWNKIKELIK